jgi:Fe-S oxidoreductase
VAALLPAVEQGAPVVVPQPTCSYVLKNEYPVLLAGDAGAQKVAAATRDLFEYLALRRTEGTLATDFRGPSPGKVAYQMPCHLRAQNMGFKTRDVLQLVPGTKVTVVEKCTAMDGTWGMKKEYYPISLEFARRAAREMEAAEPDHYMTDCSLSALQIEEARGAKPAHPASLLRAAYGLPEEH